AMPMICGLLGSGIDIRTRDKHYTRDSINDLGQYIDLVIRHGTANEESRKKSERIKALWQKWRNRVEKGERVPPPGRLPPWARWNGTRFELVPGPAAALKVIFRLAGEGLGLMRIAAHLNTKGIPPIGRTDSWRLSYLAKLLSWRAVLGEFEAG